MAGPAASPAGGAAGPVAVASNAASEVIPIDSGPSIVLYSDKARYKRGDLLHLVVRVSADCHLTLVSVDGRGRGTVIFPSDFETNSLITASQTLHLPGPGAPYAFRLKESGRERIVALCNAASATTDAIQHDFERQRFTDLGVYAEYVAAKALPTAAGPEQAAPEDNTSRRSRRRSRRQEAPERPAPPDQIARTAIVVTVEE